jgi:hypothetical protein
MDIITTLEAQHRAIAATMLRLLNLTDGFCGPGQAYVITVELTRLAHLLRVHLATEDGSFYPAMMRSTNNAVAVLAAAYRDEGSEISGQVENFIAQWNSSAVIDLGFDRFRGELRALVHQVELGIEREEDELYPLARALGIDWGPGARLAAA